MQNEIINRLWDRVITYLGKGLKTERQAKEYIQKIFKVNASEWVSEKVHFELESVIDDLMQKLVKFKFVDDEEYASEFLRSRLRSKPRSIDLIKWVWS